jgi:outer membrane protein TolC
MAAGTQRRNSFLSPARPALHWAAAVVVALLVCLSSRIVVLSAEPAVSLDAPDFDSGETSSSAQAGTLTLPHANPADDRSAKKLEELKTSFGPTRSRSIKVPIRAPKEAPPKVAPPGNGKPLGPERYSSSFDRNPSSKLLTAKGIVQTAAEAGDQQSPVGSTGNSDGESDIIPPSPDSNFPSLGFEPIELAPPGSELQPVPDFVPSRNSQPDRTSPSGPRKPARPMEAHVVPSSLLPSHAQSANWDSDGVSSLEPYQQRIAQVGEEPTFDADVPPIPLDFEPWWVAEVTKPQRIPGPHLSLELDSLVLISLSCAPQVLTIKSDQQIRETVVCEETAEFDWHAFLDNRWNDLNDPVGNTLITGGPDRYKNKLGTSTAGVRRRTDTGGTFEASQQLGWQHTNARFFVPPYQGQTRLQLTYTQPLLNGAGKLYNESRIVLAQIDADGAGDEILGSLQDHLLKVTDAYWELYRTRAVYLQLQRTLAEADRILQTIEGRSEFDVQPRQLLRARATVLRRRSDIARAEAAIRDAEARLRLLVNAPEMTRGPRRELVPSDFPLACTAALPMGESLQTALIHRPDISRAIRAIRATSLRLNMAENEIKPKLDLLLSTYVAGLAGDSDVGRSYVNQFTQARPSYTAGLLLDVPLGNRAAKAQLERRELELRRSFHELEATIETTLLQVEVAVREVQTSAREVVARYHTMLAVEMETNYLNERWLSIPGADRAATLVLEDLLDSQERLADAEREFVRAQVGYVLAVSRVRHSMGTLMEVADGPTPTLIGETSIPTPTRDSLASQPDASASSLIDPVSHEVEAVGQTKMNPEGYGSKSAAATPRSSTAKPGSTTGWKRIFGR